MGFPEVVIEEGHTKNINKCNRIFENVVFLLIVLSAILIILDLPLLDPDSTYSKMLMRLDDIFTFLFLFEAIIRIVALGLLHNAVKGRAAYLCNPWNVLDFIVVVASVTNFAFQDNSLLSSLKALRALRAMRPLRVITRNQGLKLVVNAIFSTIPAMMNVLLVCSVFLLVFSVVGIHFFKGKFFFCAGLASTADIITKADCLAAGGQWVNERSNFDDLWLSSLALFEMMTTEGWMKVMYSGLDAVGVDMQPKR